MTQIPGWTVGTWILDPAHTEIGFSVRHMMIAKVKGFFKDFEGTIVTAENPADSTVVATIEAASIDTKNKNRDAHLRSGDFLLVDEYPQITFKSTSIEVQGMEFFINGDLTMRGVTKPITLAFDLSGFAPDGQGGTKLGGTAVTTINRQDWGVAFNAAMETGGVVVGDEVNITIEVEADLVTQ